MSMRVLAPAKINLDLRVGKRRADGFHSLVSWVCSVGLFDRIEIQRVEDPAKAGLKVTGQADALTGENLVWRAVQAIGGTAATSVAVLLDKRIPIGAGLGGGSSDAARTLVALNRLLDLKLPAERVSELAAGLGSDVPLFLKLPSSMIRGRGERVDAAPAPAVRWAILILPPFQLATAEVYRKFDEMGLGADSKALEGGVDVKMWAKLPAQELLGVLRNDLEEAAFSIRRELGLLREELQRKLARPVRMSGSGSALFTLFDREQEATDAADQVAGVNGAGRSIAVPLAPEIDDDLRL